MTRYQGGMDVAGGYYLNLRGWSFEAVPGARGILPGSTESQYLRMPFVLLVPALLTVSLLFVVFFPFIGFALLAYAVALKVRKAMQSAVKAAAIGLAPTLTPGEAYLTGKDEPREALKGEPRDAAAKPAALVSLEQDIAKQRDAEDGKKD
jgi:type III secretory pathway component EscV